MHPANLAGALLAAAVLLGGCVPQPPSPAPAPAPAPPSRPPAPETVPPPPPPAVVVVERPGAATEPEARGFQVARSLEMRSTAYCLRGNMRTGVRTRDGVAAVDPGVVPLGSVLRVSRPDGRLIGTFVAMDTGGAIRGARIDLYLDSCSEARQWGVRPVRVEVIATGWGR